MRITRHLSAVLMLTICSTAPCLAQLDGITYTIRMEAAPVPVVNISPVSLPPQNLLPDVSGLAGIDPGWNVVFEDAQSRGSRLLEISSYTLTVQVIGMGILLSMDPEQTGFSRPSYRNVLRGLTSAPVVDKDHWMTNYVGHPAWGSETYLRARLADFSPLESFLYSTAASAVFEYFIEGWAEHPSRQDLLATSTIGSVIGELRFLALRSLEDHSGVLSSILRIVLDPIYFVWSRGPVVVRF